MSNAAILSDLGRLKDDLNAKLSAAAKSLQGNEEEIVELKRQNKLLIAEKDELVLNSKEEEKRLREELQASKEAQAKLEKEKNTIREEVLQSSTHIIKQYEKTVGDQRQQLTHQGQQLELLQQQLKDATQQVTAPLSPKPGTSGQPLGARSGSREAGVKEEEASQQSALHASLLLEGSRGNGGGTTSMQAESPAEPVCAVPFVPSQGRPRGGGWVRNLKGLLVQEDRQGHGSRSPDRLTEGDKKPEKQSMKGNAPSLVDDTPDVSAGSKRRRASNDLIAEEGGEAKKGSGNAGRALPRVEQKGKQSNGDKSGNRKSGSGVQRKSSKGAAA